MPTQTMWKATALRRRPVRCTFCGTEYVGCMRTDATSEFQYGTMGKDQARTRLDGRLQSGDASWEPYPCRCPKCGRFSADTVWLVRGAWGILIAITVGVTTAVLVTRETWVVYFYVFSAYPLRSLVRFYRKDPFGD